MEVQHDNNLASITHWVLIQKRIQRLSFRELLKLSSCLNIGLLTPQLALLSICTHFTSKLDSEPLPKPRDRGPDRMAIVAVKISYTGAQYVKIYQTQESSLWLTLIQSDTISGANLIVQNC
ncbi:hypothetical protein NPIL_340271 [Nephila pilipes]|uniref:Uncharacterized protein n=1 Tax=Nephila pilipes TaxID=299642 RepID=A0A8X6MRW1_NEPPI|nr:hypothetical protein NPIL_340271 [Nephila pilipes]